MFVKSFIVTELTLATFVWGKLILNTVFWRISYAS